MNRELLDELRGRWQDRVNWVRHLREKYEGSQTDANWNEYQEMIPVRDAAWKEYESAMATEWNLSVAASTLGSK